MSLSMSICSPVTLGRSRSRRSGGPGRIATQCSGSSPKGRGFGSQKGNQTEKVTTSTEEDLRSQSLLRKSTNRKLGPRPSQAPGLSAQVNGKPSISLGNEFEERLEAIRRMARQQKEDEEKKEFGPIDYDAPSKTDERTLKLGTKVGVGLAVVVFGLVFTLGDFLPSGSDNQSDTAVVGKKLPAEEKAALKSRLQQFEAVLKTSPGDLNALEGAAVTTVELGEYAQAVSLLENLSKVRNNDPEVFRLLGEVKYELKDYDGSAAAYKLSAKMSEGISFDVLRGLTNALLASKKPGEAVEVLLTAREQVNKERLDSSSTLDGSKAFKSESGNMDLVQVDLLLGKAYSDWGHVSDAVAVYDRLISSNPNDFRGYLAKGIILKENGNVGGAERMFIQARFFAPETAKTLVDRYARQ